MTETNSKSAWATSLAMSLCLSLSAYAAEPNSTREPDTSPSAPIVKLSDAVPLATMQTEDREANFTDKLTPPLASETTYFGEIDQFGEDDPDKPIAATPIIGRRSGGQWTAVPLNGEEMTNAGWKYVGAGPKAREIWGAIDTVTGENRPTFVLAHSTDGGATFEMTIFRKPCRLASFFDFSMSRGGRGRATLSLSSDCGKHKAGLYHFETKDDGKSWSPEPRYEADAMIRADEVDDDEQPDAPAEDSKKTLLRSSRRLRVVHVIRFKG